MRIFLTLLLGGLLASQTLAQALLEEHFDYIAGTSLAGQINPASGQTWALVAPASGTNIAPPTIGSGSLSHPDLAPSSGNSAL